MIRTDATGSHCAFTMTWIHPRERELNTSEAPSASQLSARATLNFSMKAVRTVDDAPRPYTRARLLADVDELVASTAGSRNEHRR